ncbi:hypothetical protein Q1695_011480 [Nippostrongylus brasiliensis]|nr:hypothetical protein Q1695_011480 [Nippostrongylus brasiliensis]
MLLLLLLVPLAGIAAVDEGDIQQAYGVLLNNTGDSNDTSGPDEDYIRKVAESVELYNIKKSSLNRQGATDTKLDETDYRNKVGPRDNRTAPPETCDKLKAVTIEGDMILSPDQIKKILTAPPDAKTKREAQTDPKAMWSPNQPIPYAIDPSLYYLTGLVNQAIQFWTQNTCLSFTNNPNAFNRLRIYKGDGCWSYVGKQPTWASQDVSIGDGCDTLTPAAENHFGINYDYGSVMQYNPYAFAVNPNVPTVYARDTNYQNLMGQRDAPAFSDVKQMNLLYNCAARCNSRPPCQNNGIVNSRTCSTCICPNAFAGNYCEALRRGTASMCNGQVIQATSSGYATFTATVGNGMTFQYASVKSDCYWHIRAPAGRRIQFQVRNLDTNCMEGCDWAGFEINTGNLDLAGMLICCSSVAGSTFTSLGSIVTIKGTSKFNNANMVINYRVV